MRTAGTWSADPMIKGWGELAELASLARCAVNPSEDIVVRDKHFVALVRGTFETLGS